MPTCPLREEKSLSQRAFSIYTDIRKLQDKAKTSYTLSTRRLRFGYEQHFFAPKQLEMITPMPEESPIHNEKNKKLIMPTEPTAQRTLEPKYLPTTIESTTL